MPMRVRYTVHNRRIVTEDRGGVARDYVYDSLGSTIALLDNTQTLTDTWTYWPYGETRTHTGASATPFLFGGVLGYYSDGAVRIYVRARHLHAGSGRWLTKDPLWLVTRAAYSYCYDRPTALIDPTGLRNCWPTEKTYCAARCRPYPSKCRPGPSGPGLPPAFCKPHCECQHFTVHPRPGTGEPAEFTLSGSFDPDGSKERWPPGWEPDEYEYIPPYPGPCLPNPSDPSQLPLPSGPAGPDPSDLPIPGDGRTGFPPIVPPIPPIGPGPFGPIPPIGPIPKPGPLPGRPVCPRGAICA
jgi:RHS repeat-associated protein